MGVKEVAMKKIFFVGLIVMTSMLGIFTNVQAGQYFYITCSTNCGIYCGCPFACEKDYKIWADDPYSAESSALRTII